MIRSVSESAGHHFLFSIINFISHFRHLFSKIQTTSHVNTKVKQTPMQISKRQSRPTVVFEQEVDHDVGKLRLNTRTVEPSFTRHPVGLYRETWEFISVNVFLRL